MTQVSTVAERHFAGRAPVSLRVQALRDERLRLLAERRDLREHGDPSTVETELARASRRLRYHRKAWLEAE
eukprot:6258722-Pyramimonas_sp.AAC.1